ncbi:hypothetical protein MMC08_005411 [Hypocenomyce scalaris]|nr:hypothetical protein [Hypocenomyce scalaris]
MQTRGFLLDSIPDRIEEHEDSAYEDHISRQGSQNTEIALSRLRRSLSEIDFDALRRSVSRDFVNTRDDLGITNARRRSGYWRESWCKLFGDDDDPDPPLSSVSSGPLVSDDGSEEDIEDAINQLLFNPVTPTSQCLSGPEGKPLGVEVAINAYLRGEYSTGDLRSEYLPKGLGRPPRTPIEKHRDTVSSRSTGRSEVDSDLASEYDHDGDEDQETPPEEWYRNAPPPSRVPLITPAAEVPIKSLAGSVHEGPSSAPIPRRHEPKPLPPLPISQTSKSPYPQPTNVLTPSSSLQLPSRNPYNAASQTTPLHHIASQRRRPTPLGSAVLPIRVSSTSRPLPPEPLEPSSSSSAAPGDESRIHPALRNSYKQSPPRYLSSDPLNSPHISALPSPISAYNPYQHKTTLSNSTQSSRPTHLYHQHKHTPSNSTLSTRSSVRHPSSTVSDTHPPPLSPASHTQRILHTSLESRGPEIPYTRRHIIESHLSNGGMTSFTNMPQERPKLHRQQTDDSGMLETQQLLNARRDQVVLNIQREMLLMEFEAAGRPPPSPIARSPSLSKSSSLSKSPGLARRLGMKSQDLLTGDPWKVDDPRSTTGSLHESMAGRRSSSLYSRDLSSVISRENQSLIMELMEEVGSRGAQRRKGGPFRKVFDLHNKFSKHRDKDMLPTSSEKAARVLGGLPGYAPSAKWKKRAKEAEEVAKAVEKLI